MESKDDDMKQAGLQLSVVKASGETVGVFQLEPDAKVEELRLEIHRAGGPPPLFQQLLCGTRELKDGQLLEGLSSDVIQLLLSLPRQKENVKVQWQEVRGTEKLLEELSICIESGDLEQTLMPTERVAACAVETNTGLVVLVGTGIEEAPSEGDKGKGKGKGHDCVYNFVRPQVLVVPNRTAPPFDIPLLPWHPLTTAVELQVVESAQGYPLPSLGLGVAMVQNYMTSGLSLVSIELVPQLLVETVIAGCDCQAFCLDGGKQCFWVDDAGGVLRCKRVALRGDAGPTEIFQLEGAVRVTSLAVARERILLTRAERHSIEVYDASGCWLMRLGDRRGCEDGPASQVRFWFPVWSQPLIAGPYGFTFKDSSPLIMGPSGSVFVYSGGVLMRLADDFLSAKKVTSVREELWMCDRDEGTPQYPEICNVVGFHDGFLYRALVRTDYREEVLLRRLRCEDFLRQPRSVLRQRAPELWPHLSDGRELLDGVTAPGLQLGLQDYDQVQIENVKPTYYSEKSRDTWDGNCRWLRETWLWEECGHPPKGLRMHRTGRLCLPPSKDPITTRYQDGLWKEATPIFDD